MANVVIQWTATATAALAKLPRKVRRGLLDKANELKTASDPAAVHKPLTDVLQGYYRISYGRYRAIYRVDREKGQGGMVVLRVRVLFVAAGIRKEGDKGDVYRLAQRLVRLGLVDSDTRSDQADV
jgi:mRNA interferase RelE/StbE